MVFANMTDHRIALMSRRCVPLWLVCAAIAVNACGSDSSNNGGGAGSTGSTGGSTGQSGSTTGAGGASGNPSGGSGGSTTASGGAGGTTSTTGAGGRPTTGDASTTGSGGSGIAGAGGSTGAGGRGGSSGGGGRPDGGAGAPADASTTAPGMSSGCGKAPTIASNMINNGSHVPLTVGNMRREYILNVPTNYDNTHAYKLIIAYHELNGNDDEMFRNQYYHLLNLANNTAIFVAPNGQQNNANCTQAGGCGWPNPNNTDLAFADALVAQLEQNFCVDTNRIFATGWSFGGSMSYKTACERPLGTANGYIRAIGVYSGSQLSGNCTPTRPVAYYASHGTGDNVLCYDETRPAGCQVGNGLSLAQNYAMANGCSFMTPTKVTSGNHVCTNMMGCMTGYPVEFCSFNGPHTPDPTDPGQRTSWEYQNVWDFFSQF
jgi:poly(3-hydroxybutyrate) depolymerase